MDLISLYQIPNSTSKLCLFRNAIKCNGTSLFLLNKRQWWTFYVKFHSKICIRHLKNQFISLNWLVYLTKSHMVTQSNLVSLSSRFLLHDALRHQNTRAKVLHIDLLGIICHLYNSGYKIEYAINLSSLCGYISALQVNVAMWQMGYTQENMSVNQIPFLSELLAEMIFSMLY